VTKVNGGSTATNFAGRGPVGNPEEQGVSHSYLMETPSTGSIVTANSIRQWKSWIDPRRIADFLKTTTIQTEETQINERVRSSTI
jgi:hypothetical protein